MAIAFWVASPSTSAILPSSVRPFPSLSSRGCCCSNLSCLLVLSVHSHALAGQDMCQSAFVPKLAVALDEPRTGLLLSAWFYQIMGERAGRSSSAPSNFEKFTRDVREVL